MCVCESSRRNTTWEGEGSEEVCFVEVGFFLKEKGGIRGRRVTGVRSCSLPF